MSNAQDIPAQAGVLPYRLTPCGPEILLVTSSTRKRWIIPKGNLEPHLDEVESARKEAYEEAGVRGRIRRVALGTYVHDGATGPTRVRVYLMQVDRVHPTWPESARRNREWMSIREARDRILEQGLRELLLTFAEEIS